MKKAQVIGQVFIYILAVLLTSLILVYGYKAIKDFKQGVDEASCLKLRNDLQNAVKELMGDFGTVRKKEFELCSGYNKICFVDYRLFNTLRPIQTTDKIILDSVESNTKKDVFLKNSIAGRSFYVGNIAISPGNLNVYCIQAINNKVVLKIESKGSYVEIGKWDD